MNLDKLFAWIITIVIMFAVSGRLDILQNWIWKAQAKVLYESRPAAWGSPRFFPIEKSGSVGSLQRPKKN
jgi:hypothetical protein